MISDIDDTQAPLIDHLIELRRRLIYAVLGLLGACIIGFFVAEPVYNFLISPLETTYASWRANALEELGEDEPSLTLEEREERVPDFELVNLNVIEPFITKLKLSLAIGFAFSFPLIAGQLYAFVAPGLYRHEKKAFLPFLAATPVLFVAGAALVYYVVMPLAWRFLLDVGQGFGSVLQQTMSSYLSIVIQMILAFGISFQLPVLLVLLGKVGIVTSAGLRSFRKYAIVGIFAFAALVTPPDFISQVVLGLPMLALYELSVFGVRLVEQKRDEEKQQDDQPDTPAPDPDKKGPSGPDVPPQSGPKPDAPKPSSAKPAPINPATAAREAEKNDADAPASLKERLTGAYKRKPKKPKRKK
ncbi:MAG: twin-arginine translocase subunit TatC [Pseudomonadota bacterium]